MPVAQRKWIEVLWRWLYQTVNYFRWDHKSHLWMETGTGSLNVFQDSDPVSLNSDSLNSVLSLIFCVVFQLKTAQTTWQSKGKVSEVWTTFFSGRPMELRAQDLHVDVHCEKSKRYLSRNHNHINTLMGMLSEIESSNNVMLYLKRLPAT